MRQKTTNHKTMKTLPRDQQPYEKFLSKGPESLSDAELLAIIIKNGTCQKSALEVSMELLEDREENLLNLYKYSYKELLSFDGIGPVKAIQLKAICELSRRIAQTRSADRIFMYNSDEVAEYYMESMRHLSKEMLVACFFDMKCGFLGDEILANGSLNQAVFSSRELFQKALEYDAGYFILIHNHPTGDPTPSKEDILATRQIKECSRIMEIPLEDHIIIGDLTYYSFRKQEQL